MDSLPAEPQEKPKNTGVGSLTLLLGNLPNPGIEPVSPALQADSLPTELSGKPATCRQLQIFLKHARVLSHFSHVCFLCNPMDYTLHEIVQARILEGIFPTQGSNPGLGGVFTS